eukprot:TRINITY_DN1257_c0_g1_i3.p1 TRINITY_DN1257_c0_g1~~TRINITY_DN1257_c0_g1_i3.p1  ORF type:complete len:175 (-),score=53.87 TRINITY_DN1257_c0_g1_i3:63-587(-)
MAWGTHLTAHRVVELWAEQSRYFTHVNHTAPSTQFCKGGIKECGDYAQMIHATTNRIGCASKRCHMIKHGALRAGVLYMCLYAPAGNVVSSFQRKTNTTAGSNLMLPPYTAGTPCSACPPRHFCRFDLCVPEALSDEVLRAIKDIRFVDEEDEGFETDDYNNRRKTKLSEVDED